MTKRLLIDNSNTRTKFTLACDAELCGDVRSFPTSSLSAQTVANLLRGWEYDEAVLCSVVPAAAQTLRSGFSCPFREISPRALCPLGEKLLRFYPHKDTLGADRLANAAGVDFSSLPCIAADLGTACTFDVIVLREGYPALLGGVIAPGLHAAAAALSSATAQLPFIHLRGSSTKFPALIATDTRQAVLSGCIHGFLGMVEGILQRLCKQLNSPPNIVVTGGDATFCTSLSLPGIKIDKYLTFRGILKLSL